MNNCKNETYPIPSWYRDPSLDYLIKFYLDVTICGNKGVECDCFSLWLRKVFSEWKTYPVYIELIKKYYILNTPLKKYNLSRMASFLLTISSINFLEELFLREVDYYYRIKVHNIILENKIRLKVWEPNGNSKVFFCFKNIEKLAKASPYI